MTNSFGVIYPSRDTTGDFIPLYQNLDSDSKLFKSITDTINLIKKNPTWKIMCHMQRFHLIISKNTK